MMQNLLTRPFSSKIPNALQTTIKNVVVVGGGLTGYGIAETAALAKNNVSLVDLNSARLDSAIGKMEFSLQRYTKKVLKMTNAGQRKLFVDNIIESINFTLDGRRAAADADLIIESICEVAHDKRAILEDLEKVAPPSAIFASNTSSLDLMEICSGMKQKERYGGIHFFRPVATSDLVEICRTPYTDDQVFQEMHAWAQSVGKTTVSCKHFPGQIVISLMIPFTLEAIRMVERGDATVSDIDIAMQLGSSHAFGPFEISDYFGVDRQLFICEAFENYHFGNDLYKVPDLMKQKVAEGKHGIKTGEGWYKYPRS